MRNLRTLALATATIVFVFMCGFAAGQRRQTPPPANEGQTQELFGTMKLAGEIPGADKFALRLRRITVQPGGALALHNHVDRPAVTYLLQGQMTYYPEGKPPVVINHGQGAGEGRGTTHWAQNTGSVPAVWIAADIFIP